MLFSSSTTAEWSNSLYSIVNSKEAQAINWQYNLYQHHYKHATPTVAHYISLLSGLTDCLHNYKTHIGSLSIFSFYSNYPACVFSNYD